MTNAFAGLRTAEAAAVARTYDAVMDVYGFSAVTGADGITTEKRELLYADVPCALSGGVNSALGGDVVSTADKFKVFCAAELEISAGCELELHQGGRTYLLRQCGVPRVYLAHQELVCVLLT